VELAQSFQDFGFVPDHSALLSKVTGFTPIA